VTPLVKNRELTVVLVLTVSLLDNCRLSVVAARLATDVL
jgi:hypothetical protein